MASEVASLADHLVRQKARQSAHGCRLAGALLAANEDAADRGVDGVEDQGQLHLVLTDDRGERVRVTVYRHGLEILPASSKLSLDRRRDLVARQVVEPVVARAHALREVG